jgi:very-short-patch-repair endonuclease
MHHEVRETRHIGGKHASRGVDAEIAALAARQHGVVSRAQLSALGLGEDGIDARLGRGRLHRIHRGAYAVGHARISRHGRWMAAVLACGDQAVLSHRSAAALWGIRHYEGRPEITAPTRRRHGAALTARRSSLDPDEITTHEGIRVTTVARTLLDLGQVLHPDQVERAIREADYLRQLDMTELETLLDRHPRRRGTAAIRKAIQQAAEARNGTRSEMEDRFISLLLKANLPRPILNATIELGTNTYEVDALWPDRKLIVELDGWQAHGTHDAFERDRERDLTLTAHGYRVVRLTWQRMRRGIPSAVKALVAQ